MFLAGMKKLKIIKMIKTKYLLYFFKYKENRNYSYWYKTDNNFFKAEKPIQAVLNKIPLEKDTIENISIINNPWVEWNSNDIQKITSQDGTCINYLKTTNNDLIQKQEDLSLLETYTYLTHHLDISKSFDFNIIKKWHKMIFKNIYPFAGDLRTVTVEKGINNEHWIWKLEFLNGIPELNTLIKNISSRNYSSIDAITSDLAELICDFLFIHPFREGNGRLSRLLSDIILAKNNFPMIGLNLKQGDNYIERVHAGYTRNYLPMKELLKSKIEEIMIE